MNWTEMLREELLARPADPHCAPVEVWALQSGRTAAAQQRLAILAEALCGGPDAAGLPEIAVRACGCQVPQTIMPGLKKRCCASAFLSACLLGYGRLSAGQQLHLELSFPAAATAVGEALAAVAGRLKVPLHRAAGERLRLYSKAIGPVTHMLSLCQAHCTRLELESQSAGHDMNRAVQRRVNCDAANAGRTALAVARQTLHFEMLLASGMRLPESLIQAAQMRIEHPDDSLSELAARLGLTKSALNHRLRRLEDISVERNGKNMIK